MSKLLTSIRNENPTKYNVEPPNPNVNSNMSEKLPKHGINQVLTDLLETVREDDLDVVVDKSRGIRFLHGQIWGT